jgi:hypothetical protein
MSRILGWHRFSAVALQKISSDCDPYYEFFLNRGRFDRLRIVKINKIASLHLLSLSNYLSIEEKLSLVNLGNGYVIVKFVDSIYIHSWHLRLRIL